MIAPHEMIVDLFAGGGGASVGILRATGRHPDLAVNHDATAIAVHTANHPGTRHAQASVWKVEPREACAGRPVGLLWASPDCRHFSRASGGAARWPKIRTLPGVVITWASRVRPRIIVVENVAEMQGWGPLLENGQPCPARIGRSFKAWCGRLRGLGYTIEWRQLCAADFGAPTTRRRLFVVARCDGEPITWPQPTHSRRPSMFEAPWRTAAECIDWSIPCPSIFARGKELAEKTQARIAYGVRRFVLDAADPFIVQITQKGDAAFRGQGLGDPLRTITCAKGGEFALLAPVLTGCGGRAGQSPPKSAEKHAVVAAFLAQHNTGVIGHSARRPVSTIMTAGCHQQLVTATLTPAEAEGAERVAAFLLRYNGTNIGQRLDAPLGTATTKERFALVTVAGVPHVITDIGMRMLHWRELAAAQGLPDDYRWIGEDGAELGKTKIIRLIGNSVSPPPAEALLRALLGRREERRAA
ncbi:MAG TPA: DNA cytosine methyltransferase [Roseococcus sp.]|nr:DNA cytosine methyltransferase [Roseococcus sp.]